MSKKLKPTIFSAAREGNIADLNSIFSSPDVNVNEIPFVFTDCFYAFFDVLH